MNVSKKIIPMVNAMKKTTGGRNFNGHTFKIMLESFRNGKLVIIAENKKYKCQLSFGGDPI